MDLSKMVFVTGFTRGGTTWMRNAIGSHPDVGVIPKEIVVFREHRGDRGAIARSLEDAVRDLDPGKRFFVEKSPANAPYLDEAVRLLPEARFVFVIRDPRDAFVSHKRGTAAWMGGRNSEIAGCLGKLRRYYQGYERAREAPNLRLTRYEDLHQSFEETLRELWEFIGLEASDELLERAREENDFWRLATRHRERRDQALRRGVVGDWVSFLDPEEERWVREDEYWQRFLARHGYDGEPLTCERVLAAVAASGARALDEEDLLRGRLRADRLNVLLFHDVDSLRADWSRDSIRALVQAEARLGLRSFCFFLPLDDPRYQGVGPEAIRAFIEEIRRDHGGVTVGLHLNAAERFFPPELEDAGDAHPDLAKAVAYLHAQVDAYEALGIRFRVATAHGYGRRKKRPNNRDSPVFAEALQKRGVLLWDTLLAPPLLARARHLAHLADLGGALAATGLPAPGALTDPETYRSLPPGALLHLLTHPGNYDARKPLPLGRRARAPLRPTQPARP